ncbi:cellulose biosynthesis cyclic di-GMP-binding regulatory protein BcsB [Shimwellia pseudoproteus]|uniref:cellulose biosynthesis cyclic di-GMP-binding regulatory protein BcsB n=1 Tax=Shimwellia pseudoproteus TaxID=570012 RepID=UPI0018EBD8F9|nr:cellulose biosynthesis cyclic di-GMP-binding regulatory protein BcsB [Shimwellia pseudoproteus]MBJ3814274.1 cellulose biosynthesis cyclic di-GMP-binding regulatory protein BcsB [Shimwellia pseudoproteus]
MKRKFSWFYAALLGMGAFPAAQSGAEPTALPKSPIAVSAPVTRGPGAPGNITLAPVPLAPQRAAALRFADIAPAPGNITLRGTSANGVVEFGVRRDEVVSQAVLNLDVTPSPSLIPGLSQLKVYLNDELMSVVAFSKEQLGKKNQLQLPIDPLYITDFNRIRLEFIGHYREVCENPANTTLWLDIGRDSNLALTYQTLVVKNDLSNFPLPFYDARDTGRLTLPMVFAGVPDTNQQKAAAILSSWFGAQAQWRGQAFPVFYNQLPEQNSIVFATNDQRPDFLRDHPPVNAPTVEMVSHPDKPWIKTLVIFGRDDNDLIQAARGIVKGDVLLRGDRVTVDEVKPLAPRKPYDAPNWIRTDSPVTFGELKTYQGQLQSIGLQPSSITLNLNLPPDLYLLRSTGIDMDLKYRYTAPPDRDSSRMDVNLNDQLLKSFGLLPKREKNELIVRLPILQGLLDAGANVSIPALRLGAANKLRFDFQYMNPMPGGSIDNCVTYQPVLNKVVLDENSTIDFSHYYHFIAMPDLRVYANAGFPFSRMADLSETLIMVPAKPRPNQVEALLDAVGTIGSQTGIAASNLTLSDDPRAMKGSDNDMMIIGTLPAQLKDDSRINLLMASTQAWVKTPMRQAADDIVILPEGDRTAENQTTMTSDGAMAAIVGFQSPYNDQRSVIALLADSPRGYQLLNNALNDSGKRAAIAGSVSVIRESGVQGIRVGDIYYVGHLPWFERLWFALSNHPILLAILAAISVVLLAWILWRLLRIMGRRRLDGE